MQIVLVFHLWLVNAAYAQDFGVFPNKESCLDTIPVMQKQLEGIKFLGDSNLFCFPAMLPGLPAAEGKPVQW